MAKRTKADEKFNMTLKEARAKADWPCGKVSVLKRALGRLQALLMQLGTATATAGQSLGSKSASLRSPDVPPQAATLEQRILEEGMSLEADRRAVGEADCSHIFVKTAEVTNSETASETLTCSRCGKVAYIVAF